MHPQYLPIEGFDLNHLRIHFGLESLQLLDLFLDGFDVRSQWSHVGEFSLGIFQELHKTLLDVEEQIKR